MSKPVNKSFDCVTFKHKAQSRIYRKIAKMDAASQIAYFEAAAERGSLGRWWQRVRKAQLRKNKP
ncbi:MAG TPA: hypothetical protein VMG59_08000 [Phycisphaerae bacterium]|nr:hypothetical protein [Phycisphaerae bacterium]